MLSGTTWMGEVLSLWWRERTWKRTKDSLVTRVPYIEINMPGPLQFSPPSACETARLARPSRYDFFQRHIETDSLKVILLLRNPKDALTSCYYFYKHVLHGDVPWDISWWFDWWRRGWCSVAPSLIGARTGGSKANTTTTSSSSRTRTLSEELRWRYPRVDSTTEHQWGRGWTHCACVLSREHATGPNVTWPGWQDKSYDK